MKIRTKRKTKRAKKFKRFKSAVNKISKVIASIPLLVGVLAPSMLYSMPITFHKTSSQSIQHIDKRIRKKKSPKVFYSSWKTEDESGYCQTTQLIKRNEGPKLNKDTHHEFNRAIMLRQENKPGKVPFPILNMNFKYEGELKGIDCGSSFTVIFYEGGIYIKSLYDKKSTSDKNETRIRFNKNTSLVDWKKVNSNVDGHIKYKIIFKVIKNHEDEEDKLHYIGMWNNKRNILNDNNHNNKDNKSNDVVYEQCSADISLKGNVFVNMTCEPMSK